MAPAVSGDSGNAGELSACDIFYLDIASAGQRDSTDCARGGRNAVCFGGDMKTPGRFPAILALAFTLASSAAHADQPIMGCCVCTSVPKCDNGNSNGCAA